MACFFDVKKCFDTINRSLLLQKLSFYGFRDSSFKWFSNYLNTRKQFVACNRKYSINLPINTGVPQGSALGPLLFLIFVNDFPQHISHSSSNMFADDNCVYITGKLFNETKSYFQESVNEAGEWYMNNNLPINTDKSLCMLAASETMLRRISEECKTLNITVNDNYLNQVSEHPYLGIYLDNSMKWNKQVLQMCSNVSRKLALLRRLRKTLNSELLNMLYISMIQPILDYGISVWGYCSDTNRELIVRLQHRAARIITGNMDYINTRGGRNINSGLQ